MLLKSFRISQHIAENRALPPSEITKQFAYTSTIYFYVYVYVWCANFVLGQDETNDEDDDSDCWAKDTVARRNFHPN